MTIDCRTVTMAEDADMGLCVVQPFARLIREMSLLKQNVPYGDGRAGAPDDAHARESAPLKVIDVTRHRNDRCDLLEPPDDVRIPDVAGVENGRHAGKMLGERRIEEPMRIGNHADTSEALWFHGAATG